MKTFEQAVKDTKRVVTIMKSHSIFDAIELIHKEIPELRGVDFVNKSALQEYVLSSKEGFAHSQLFIPENIIFTGESAKPDAWRKLDNDTFEQVEIKSTMKNEYYTQIRRKKSKYGIADDLICTDTNGNIRFEVVYNSISSVKKIKENAKKHTVAVVFNDKVCPLFSAVISGSEILRQSLKIYEKARKDVGGDKDWKYTRNGNKVFEYISPNDITYYDKSYKRLFGA